MSIRNEPIYISYEVYSWLRLIGKATPARSDACQIQTMTPDEVADTFLRQAITEKHPSLVEYQKALDEGERKLIESLKPQLTGLPTRDNFVADFSKEALAARKERKK